MIHDKLKRKFTIEEWMTKNPMSIGPKTSVRRAFFLIKKNHIRFLPVTVYNTLVGLVTDRDLRLPVSQLKNIKGVYRLDEEITVKDIMTTKLITLSPHDNIQTAAYMAVKYKVGGFPIVTSLKTRELVGVITYTDILNALIYIMDIEKL